MPSDDLVLSRVTLTGSSYEGVFMENNLYFQQDPDQRIVTVDALGSFHMDEWETYQSETGYDASSPAPADPLLADPEQGDFTPLEASPTRDAGLHVEGLTDGFIGDAPDIGVVERP